MVIIIITIFIIMEGVSILRTAHVLYINSCISMERLALDAAARNKIKNDFS